MKDVRNEKNEVKKFRKLLEMENAKRMAWVLVLELITYINNDEKNLLAESIEKVKKNTFLKNNKEFMKKVEEKDIQYLLNFKEEIKP